MGGTLTLEQGAGLNALSVDVNAGKLVLSAGGQLRNGVPVSVSNGAVLQIDGDEATFSFRLDGTLTGTGRLVVADSSTIGGEVLIPLETKTLDVYRSTRIGAPVLVRSDAEITAGTLTMAADGRLSARNVRLSGGGLATTTDSQLEGTRSIWVGPSQSLNLAGRERIDSLALAGGSLDGSGRLSADGAVLDSGSINARLDVGSLVSQGDSVVRAPVTAATRALVTGRSLLVTSTGTLTSPFIDIVSDASLDTAAGERLGPASRVRMADGARLNLGGAQTVTALIDLPDQAANGSAVVRLGADRLTVSDGSGQFSGQLTGDGSIDKQGNGIWVLGRRQQPRRHPNQRRHAAAGSRWCQRQPGARRGGQQRRTSGSAP